MTTTRPNILWICTDQQRWDTLGCYGHDTVATPTLDALAADGVRFDRAFAQSPVCTPSRASMMTGRYPRTTRCRQNGQPLPETEHLVTALLASTGYHCGLAGKLHLSPTNPDNPTDRREHEPARALDDGYGSVHWSSMPGRDLPNNEYHQWLQRHGERYDPTPYEGSAYVETGPSTEYHHSRWCTNRAIDYVRTAAETDAPWMFSLNYFDPHHPFDPPREYLERYVEQDIELPDHAPEELDEKTAVQRAAATEAPYGGATMNADDHRLIRAAYYAMIDHLDDQIGRLLDALTSTGQRDDTLVIFSSDHGEMLGDHGLYKKGPYFYDPAIRVPLIFSWPDGGTSGVVDDLVELVDVVPTILDAAGCDYPPGIQGRSLLPRLLDADQHKPESVGDTTDLHRESVYCEFYNASRRHTDPPIYATMVRTARYKLVRHHGPEDGELYDLEADPAERKNYWDEPGYADIQRQLLTRLTDRMAQTVDPLPERRGSW